MKTKIISVVLLLFIFTGCFSGYCIAFGVSSSIWIAEEGTVETPRDYEVDENFHIDDVVTNDNEFIPEDEQGLLESERFATEASKYNFDQNPLIHRDRMNNKEVLPTFNIDETGFVRRGTKIKDLKGKTLMFYTPDTFSAWSYRNAKGENVEEWKWFDQLKGEIGLTVKYTVSSGSSALTNSLKDMNAGKQCDIIYSTQFSFPTTLSLSRSITDLININNIGSSPGVCKTTMDICKWGNSLRVIAPIGVVDVLWYNQTLTQELGLPDPHTMWEYDKWDWNAYSKFQKSIPQKTADGKTLTAMVHWPRNTSYIWPSTTGTSHITIDADNPYPAIVNNWDADTTMRAWEFITGVANSTNYAGPGSEDLPGQQKEHNGLYEGTTLMSGTMFTQIYRNTEYSKHVRINWVPYPKEKARTLAEMQAVIDNKYSGSDVKPAASHDGVAQSLGYAMLLPKVTVKEDNVGIALKFMELWATRFTETYFDNLNVFEYHKFNYLQRKQYFDFVTQNVVFALPMNNFEGSDVSTSGHFFECFSGDPTYNVRTEATKISNLVHSYIVDSLRYPEEYLCIHNFGQYVYNNDATYDADGTKTRTCSLCTYRETVIVEGTKLERKDGWAYENGWYYYENGKKLTNCWKKDSVGWCWLEADGKMATNKWVKDSVGWCYVGANGYCLTNTWKKDSVGWCYLNSEGSMTKNAWVLDGGKWYFLDGNGYMVSNAWRKDSTGWCYLGADGAMQTNKWIKDSVGWCYVGANGYCLTNAWMKDSIGWCYLGSDGRMVTNGWVQDSHGWCYLNSSGYWNGVYYMFEIAKIC